MSESYPIIFRGRPIRAVLDHGAARVILSETGLQPPAIPNDSNTASLFFRTAEGYAALYIHQRAPRRITLEDEEPIKSAMCLVLLELPAPAGAEQVLEQVKESLVPPIV